MKLSLTILGLLAALTSGCAQREYVKMYEGEIPGGLAPALVKPVAATEINGVDGGRFEIHPGAGLSTEYELEFAPGKHVLKVAYRGGTRESRGSVPLTIMLAPGRRYIVRPIVTGPTWRPALIDVTDKPQCWTLGVGTNFYGINMGPEGCDEPK